MSVKDMQTTKQIQAVTSNLQEAQRIASGSGSEEDIAEAKIQIEVRAPSLAMNSIRGLTWQVLEALNSYVK